MKKIVPLICGIGGIIVGLVLIAFLIMEKEITKPLWFVTEILNHSTSSNIPTERLDNDSCSKKACEQK